MSGPPDPKSRTLARGERRTMRHKATKAEWERIVKAKRGPCRVCGLSGGVLLSFHHVVPRSLGGDDVEDNIVPLCGSGVMGCHGCVEDRVIEALETLGARLTDAEYAYVVGRLGEGALERLFGVTAR